MHTPKRAARLTPIALALIALGHSVAAQTTDAPAIAPETAASGDTHITETH